MSLWKIAWRSIQQRALASWLTGLSMALGVALVVIVLVVHGLVSRTFTDAAQGYHLIVGKKGSSTQLVLNTVFHMQRPIENLPWSYYKQLKKGKVDGSKYPVQAVVPFCLGDSYEDFRVVGTTLEMFEKLSYGDSGDGQPKMYRCAAGRFFTDDEDDYFGAVIGSVAARKARLTVGQKFSVTHGLVDDVNAHVHEDEKFTVLGILEPTGTPNDRAVFINIEGFFLISGHAKEKPEEADHDKKPAVDDHDHGKDADHEKHDHDKKTTPAEQASGDAHEHEKNPTAAVEQETGAKHDDHAEHSDEKPAKVAKPHEHAHHDDHDHHGHDHHGHAHHEPLPEDQREVTSILVLMADPGGDAFASEMMRQINKGIVAQAVSPIREVSELMEGLVGTVRWLLLVLSGLVVLVAGIGVMVSIYNSMSDRRRDIAIMRSLGAGRNTVMFVVLLESIILSVLGGLAGVVLAHVVIGALSGVIVNQTGVTVNMFQFEPIELVIIPGLVVLASLVGYLPALAAYRTDVAKALSSAP